MQEDLIEHELPPRPRRRLFRPVPIALLCMLLTACGFIGGVLVEKGQSASTSSGSAGAASGFASRLAALRSGTSGAAGSTRGASLSAGASRGARGDGSAEATIGQVAYTSGHTLYVTNPEGNTVKVTTSTASTVTKTIKSEVKAIHPGETVLVTGSAGADGAVKASSIRVSEAGSGGALGALFGGGGGFSGRGRSGGGGREAAGGGGGGEAPVLFGK